MLNKWNMKVAEFAASRKESRYMLQAIQVAPDATVATDSHMLCWVSANNHKAKDFPAVDGAPELQDKFATFLLDTDTAKDVAKRLPKRTTIPILANVGISVATSDAGTQATLVTTDLERPVVLRPRPVEGRFPNWQMVMPNYDKPKFRVTVNAAYLAKIAKAYADFVKEHDRNLPVTVSFYGDDKAIRFDGTNGEQGMTCVLMPIRGTDDYFGTYGWTEREAKREAERKAEREKERKDARAEANTEAEAEAVEDSTEAAMAEEAHSRPEAE